MQHSIKPLKNEWHVNIRHRKITPGNASVKLFPPTSGSSSTQILLGSPRKKDGKGFF
jgi:hypothetical protein